MPFNLDLLIWHAGANCLGELLKVNNSLQELNMHRDDIGDDEISLVANGLQHNNTLTKLDVSECSFSKKGTVVYS